jgi:predicted PurR-regulated permease PerM
MKIVLLTAIVLLAVVFRSYAGGDSTVLDKIAQFPSRVFNRTSGKISSLQKQLDKQTDKYVQKLMRREARLKKKLSRLDSNSTKVLYSGSPDQEYAGLLRKMKSDTSVTAGIRPLSGDYYAYADSLQGSLSFLNKNPELLSGSGTTPAQVQSTLNQLKVLQSKMQDADALKQYIQQRKEQLKQYLSRYTSLPPGITNAYQDYNKQLYYYTEQVKQYK